MENTLETDKNSTFSAPVILRVPQVQRKIGLGRSSLYSMLNPGSPHHDATFPRPIRISARAVGWLDSEISDWITKRSSANRC